MVAGNFAKILLSLDASAVDSMLFQKLTQALRFDILIFFLYRLSFVWYKFQKDSLLLYQTKTPVNEVKSSGESALNKNF